MEYTIDAISDKLVDIRKQLNLSQSEVAKQIGARQEQISQLENAKSGGLKFFLSLISFYSNFVPITAIFNDEDFDFENNKFKEFLQKRNNSIIHEKIQLQQDDTNKMFDELKGLFKKK